jgi:hypothetical protein
MKHIAQEDFLQIDGPAATCRKCHQLIALGHADWCRLKDRKPKPIQDNLLQLPLGFSGPRVRAVDPDTSKQAAQSITQKRLTEIQQDILAWFRCVHHATDEELETHFRDKYPAQTTVSKRRTDLVRLGYLRDSGERRKNSNMRSMIVWELIS